jgi:hypothetical protein
VEGVPAVPPGERLLTGPAGVWCQLGWHLIALHRCLFETVGFFDEAFWPAYWEETDFLYRLKLAGLVGVDDEGNISHDSWLFVDVDGEFGRQAATLQDCLAPVNLMESQQRYEAKWGGPSGAEQFTVPFGVEA